MRKKILITGATGYIGRRLKNRLLSRGDYDIRLLVRNKNKVRESVRNKVEIIEGDTFKTDSLAKATKGIDIAYYLIHSMGAGKDYDKLDRQSAENFRDACIQSGVQRIIYLGGLGVKESASKHLLSRIETGEILSARDDEIQTLWFRAGVIIGSGSASFEIIRNLVQKLPLMTTPRWVNTKTQPVAVDDVIGYLESAIELPQTNNLVVDIGTKQMSFREMLLGAAKVMGLRRMIIPVPVLSPKLSSYWLILVTTVPYKIASALVEGLKSETIKLNDNAVQYFPDIKPISYEKAVGNAINDIEQNQVLSRWCDSSSDKTCDIPKQDDVSTAILHDQRTIDFSPLMPEKVFQSILSIGGRKGWFSYHFLWIVRGGIDKLLGGYGLARGRRHDEELRIGDALDFWKVADIKPNKRLLLLAQMKLPGKAWLEFDIQGSTLVQTAHFYPKGLWGRLYWYTVSPLHNLVFQDLVRNIVQHAKEKNTGKEV